MNTTVIIIFLFFVSLTLIITYFASKRTNSAEDFYTAGGGLTGWQNGLAIAGDYLSAASFLGIAGAIALWGFDGFFYSIGYLTAYLIVIIYCCRTFTKLREVYISRYDCCSI
ncbi:truncated sodium-dependent symporter homolog [Macrococcoides caseolyticum JCSC5402]|uniref:Truncated sodium-dependent symporter homolog n=1 Tax=Macrococcus caseolyticus (strain JCSC5402) TaxID=458233 RepID=B9E980_MACCJ|nr:truncated sodium-dependent symporter homolog [Macrococcus caseolyticus JCSC5402]